MGWLVKFRSWSSIRKQIRKEYKASIANWTARTYQQSNYLLRDKLGSTRALLKCGNLVPRSCWPKLRHYEWRFDEPIVRITGYMVKNFGFNGWQWVLNGPFSSSQRDVKRSVQWKTKTSIGQSGHNCTIQEVLLRQKLTPQLYSHNVFYIFYWWIRLPVRATRSWSFLCLELTGTCLAQLRAVILRRDFSNPNFLNIYQAAIKLD